MMGLKKDGKSKVDGRWIKKCESELCMWLTVDKVNCEGTEVVKDAEIFQLPKREKHSWDFIPYGPGG